MRRGDGRILVQRFRRHSGREEDLAQGAGQVNIRPAAGRRGGDITAAYAPW